MFYSHLVLTKKGPLGHVWLAAQLGENRVSKRFASQAKIDILCNSIEQPAAPFALRLSAHLMMGVTRVYSRKSTIVLSNASKVLSALHRMHAEALELNRKRRCSSEDAQPGAEVVAIGNHFVTESPARFEDITLPARPRKRIRRKSADTYTLDLPIIIAQHSAVNMTGRRISNGAGSSIGLDVQFPSIQFGGSDTRLRTITTPFRAREEDITLHPGSDQALGSQDFAIDLGDIARDLNFNRTSQFNEGSSYDNGSAEFAAAFGRKTDSSGRGTPSARSGAPGRSMIEPPLNVESVIVEDMLMPEIERDPTSVTRTALPSNRTGHNTRDASSRTARKSKRSSIETLRTKRSAGILSERMRYTEQTELSTGQIREWQTNTTDIVIPPGAPRPYARRARAPTDTLEELFNASNPFGDMADEIANLWLDNVVQPCLAELDIQPKIEKSKSVADGSSLRSNGVRTAESHPSPEYSAWQKTPRVLSQGDDLFVERPLDMPLPPPLNIAAATASNLPHINAPVLESQPGYSSILPPLFPSGGSKSGSLKDGSQSKEISMGSGPSGSGGALSIGQSSSAGSKVPERLRDNELEITPQDRAEFAKARRLSGLEIRLDGLSASATPTVRETPERMPVMVSSAKVPRIRRSLSEQEIEMQAKAVGSGDAERLPVGESDLRLEEQTEEILRVDNQGEGLTAIEQLNVHSFKLLQILRDIDKTEAEEGTRICVFASLVDGMSKRGCSRAYLNLITLASVGFIRVQQATSYAMIDIYPGKYFR